MGGPTIAPCRNRMLDCTFVYCLVPWAALPWRHAETACWTAHCTRLLAGSTLNFADSLSGPPIDFAKPLAHTLQVDAIVSTAEPYAQSARKRARRLSVAAGDFARRSMGGTGSKFHAR